MNSSTEISGRIRFFPALDVTLIGPNGEGEEDLVAIVDTGAKYCLFSGLRAAPIGLDLMAGRREILSILAGQLVAGFIRWNWRSSEPDFDVRLASASNLFHANCWAATLFSIKFVLPFANGISTG